LVTEIDVQSLSVHLHPTKKKKKFLGTLKEFFFRSLESTILIIDFDAVKDIAIPTLSSSSPQQQLKILIVLH